MARWVFFELLCVFLIMCLFFLNLHWQWANAAECRPMAPFDSGQFAFTLELAQLWQQQAYHAYSLCFEWYDSCIHMYIHV